MPNRYHELQKARELARQIAALSIELVNTARTAHDAGASWADVAAAVQGRYPSGIPAALGDMLPGGRSVTSVREFVLARTSP